MKKIILLTITASAAIAAYFALRYGGGRKENHGPDSIKRERHLTDAFSRAKQRSKAEVE